MRLQILVLLCISLFLGCPGPDENNCSAAAPTMSPETLPDGIADEAYSQQLTAFGGEEVFSVVFGTALPDGLTLSEAGLISGTPGTAGEFEFSVRSTVDDTEAVCDYAAEQIADYTLTIEPRNCSASAPDITPATLPEGVVNEAYSQQLTAFGGEEVFSLDSGALPDGLSLSEDGLISGTPSAAGDFEFSVGSTVDDSEAECPVHPAFAEYTLTIAEAG